MKRIFTPLWSSVCMSALLLGCQITGSQQAPVAERPLNSATRIDTRTHAPIDASSVAKPNNSNTNVTTTAAANNEIAAPKPVAPVIVPGKTYLVKRGDTLYSIALEHGKSYRDLASWNQIVNPNYIQADQVLRLTQPETSIAASATAQASAESTVAVAMPIPVVTSNPPVTLATNGAAGAVKPVSSSTVGVTPAVTPSPATTTSQTSNNTNASESTSNQSGDIVWSWPVKGKVVDAYVEGKNKGVGITGSLGEQVTAAADGKVIYAQNALKGYGHMVIIKHNDTFITAYAHNSRLVVKEEQTVKRGQVIAEMGNTDVEGGKVKLHFEVRRNGKPLDPVKLLPAR